MRWRKTSSLLLTAMSIVAGSTVYAQSKHPNIVIIYADDLGYGDISCYGATKIRTPNLDRLASQGLRFTNAHSSSATCTPSRYSMLTGDNGPVVDDGYKDQAFELLDGHKPSGPLRGGKYSAFDAGTRVAFIVRWPGHVKTGVSDALVSQVDFLSSFAKLTGVGLAAADAPDSYNVLDALLGQSKAGRDQLVEHAGTLSLVRGQWKYIEPSNGPRMNKNTNTELGNDPQPQLYDLAVDLGEKENVGKEHPDLVREMAAQLKTIRDQGHSRP